MGRITDGKSDLAAQAELFGSDLPSQRLRRASLMFMGSGGEDLARVPIHSNVKSKLISEYIAKYQMVTHGGLFIDGFSAPQSRSHPEAWTARRVLELEPKWIRCFWLCDLEATGLDQLAKLKAAHHLKPKSRSVFVMRGDFNQTIDLILKSPKLRRKTPTFALLDQRTAECHWRTVEKIAARSSGLKIEILYFLGTSWLHRSLAATSTDKTASEKDAWWGGPGWRDLIDLNQAQVVQVMADRFADELGYEYVTPYPVFRNEGSATRVFYLIHASDHAQAPRLMKSAYRKVVGNVAGTPTDGQMGFRFPI